jgi:RNA polymerase sigma factor (sigma-70 family)
MDHEHPAAGLEEAYRENRQAFLARAARSARNGVEAEDILHDVFLRLLANAHPLDAIGNLTALIYKAIRNRVIDLWRYDSLRDGSTGRKVTDETIAEIVAGAGFDPADLLLRKELYADLSEAIVALPEEQRSVIEGQVLDGATFRELAEKTGLPVNTLMTRKRLAIRKLSSALKDWYADD